MSLIPKLSYAQIISEANFNIIDYKYNDHLNVYMNRNVGMDNDLTVLGNIPIVAYADKDEGGKLSIAEFFLPYPDSSYSLKYIKIAKGISDGPVSNVVLKNYKNTIYVAYTDDYSNSFHLKWRKNGETQFTDYPFANQLMGINPHYLNLAITSDGYPTIIYTQSSPKSVFMSGEIYIMKCNNTGGDPSIGCNGFTQHIKNQAISSSNIKGVYDSNNNLYILYETYNNCPGIVKLDNENNWIYLNNDYASFFKPWSSEFVPDITIYKDTLYLAMGHYDDTVSIYSYDTQRANAPLVPTRIQYGVTRNSWHSVMFDSIQLLVDNNGSLFISNVAHGYAIPGGTGNVNSWASLIGFDYPSYNSIAYTDFGTKDRDSNFEKSILANTDSTPNKYSDILAYSLVQNGDQQFYMFLVPPKK